MTRSVPPADAKIGKKIDFIAVELGGLLKPYGFVRKSRKLWRELSDGENKYFYVLDLQGGKWNYGSKGEFCICIGVQFPLVYQLFAEMVQQPWRLEYAEQPDTTAACVKGRLDDALPEQREDWWRHDMVHGNDLWFKINEHTDLEALSALICRAVSEYVLPWFDRHGSLDGVFAHLGHGLPDFEHYGCCLVAGVLMGRKAEVAEFFTEKGSRGFHGTTFQNVQDWLLSRGVDVAGVTFTPEPPNPRIEQRNAEFESARIAAEAAEIEIANNPAPLPERLQPMLDAYVEMGRTHWELTPDSPIKKQLMQADAETKRHIILTILQRLVEAPTKLPSLTPGIWGNMAYVHDQHWGDLVIMLIKGLPCDKDFARGLLTASVALIGRYERPDIIGFNFTFPFVQIVKYLNQHAMPWSEALKQEVAALFEAIRQIALAEYDESTRSICDRAQQPDASETTKMLAECDHEATRLRISDYPEQSFVKTDREAIAMLRKWLKRGADGQEPLEIEQDDWGSQLTETLTSFPGDQTVLMNLLSFIAKDVPTRPTQALNKRLAEFLALLKTEPYQADVENWLETLLCAYARSDLTYEWATTAPKPGVGAFLGVVSGNILLGLIHLVRLWDADRFASALATVAEAGFTVVPGIRMRSQKVGIAAVDVLDNSTKGRQQLAEMRQRTQKPSVCKVIDSALRG